ncbi:hypothetical protein KK083_05685 [Fulvivirgaceae bacterium PWU4]|uniref:Uncharacterized protein n=1 Tax=Chryseosolibacter histidini TaxID=2782349 RepID=A0AAP2DHH1_9BACT|nr:hypothetical protein [Chryseosolibacter histidini]MBT1696356.1 hypothetical protein [Chryseosolibacter histidini]
MKNAISLHVSHPSAKRTEHFLNRVEEELVQIPFDWQKLKRADVVSGAAKLVTKDRSIAIVVVFADSYLDANEIASANAFPELLHARWTVNGDVLYLVEAADQDKVSALLSLFAGEE